MQSLVLIDGPGLLRSLLTRHLQHCADSFNLFEADDVEALAHLSPPQPALILLVHRSGTPDSGVEAIIGEVHQRFPRVPIGVLSDQDDYATAQRVVASGAQGLISMRSCASSLIPILQLLAAGETYVPCSALAGKDSAPDFAPPLPSLIPSTRHDLAKVHLTSREDQILGALRLGKSNKEIARLLAIKENTVKIHLRHIFRKFGARTRCEAIVLAETKTWKAPGEPINLRPADVQQSTLPRYMPTTSVKFNTPIRIP